MMAYQPTAVERASDALRHVSSLAIAASLIASGSSLGDKFKEECIILDLLAIAEAIAERGCTAMEEIEVAVERMNAAA